MTTPELATDSWVPDDLTFGARLALIRQRMGWNVKEAALACGLPAQSWRGWEIGGREPHRRTTIAMTIAAKTGCDFLWLVHGPDRGGAQPPRGYFEQSRTIRSIGSPDTRSGVTNHRGLSPTRSVRQTRPMSRSRKPPALVAV